jgi:hypothetical protein
VIPSHGFNIARHLNDVAFGARVADFFGACRDGQAMV